MKRNFRATLLFGIIAASSLASAEERQAVIVPSAIGAPATRPGKLIDPAWVKAVVRDLRSEDWEMRSKAFASEPFANLDVQDTAVLEPLVEPLMTFVGFGGLGGEFASAAQKYLVQIGKPAVPKLLAAMKAPETRLRRSGIGILTQRDQRTWISSRCSSRCWRTRSNRFATFESLDCRPKKGGSRKSSTRF
jgi:hypothetical protein